MKQNKMSKIVALLAGALISLCSTIYPADAQNKWMTVQPTFNVKQKQLTARLEEGVELSERLSFYGFSDIDSKKQDIDLENFYSELRVTYNLVDKKPKFGIAAEYNGGNDVRDIIRFGFTTNVIKNGKNIAFFKYYPIETSGKQGSQLGYYFLRNVTDKLTISTFGDYNIKPNKLYFELELDYRIKNSSLSLEGRTLDNDGKLYPYIGFKRGF